MILAPPPGPLAWLHPELATLERGPFLSHEHFAHGVELELRAGARCDVLAPRLRAAGVALRSGERTALERVLFEELSRSEAPLVRLVREGEQLHWAPAEAGQAGLLILPLDPLREPPAQALRAEPVLPIWVQHEATHPWRGVVPRAPRFHERMERALRTHCPQRLVRWKAFQNHAQAGWDLYGESVARRRPSEAEPAGARPLVLGVDGIDGAGKSTLLDVLEQELTRRGLSTSRHKIYRHGVFHDTVTDLTRRCAGGANLELWRLQRQIKLNDSLKYFASSVAPALEQSDALLFDRYVYTHYAAGVGRYHHDPLTREMLACYPRPDRVWLIDLPVEVALERIERRSARTVDENAYMLERYRHVLRVLAARHRLPVLDGTRPAEELADQVRAELVELLEARA